MCVFKLQPIEEEKLIALIIYITVDCAPILQSDNAEQDDFRDFCLLAEEL